MHQKRALDSVAEQYWTEYFGDYGKAWTRKVPKKVARALAKRFASPMTHAVVAPYGYAPREDGGLQFEGVFRGLRGEERVAQRAFSATFDKDGALVSLEVA